MQRFNHFQSPDSKVEDLGTREELGLLDDATKDQLIEMLKRQQAEQAKNGYQF
jgi:hypothetical protein